MNLKFSKYRFLILLCFVITITYGQEEAKIWQKFTGKISNPEIPVLFDYSYAGYQLGAIGVPKKFKNLKVFKVTDFGAIANDTISDQEAIQATINAAEKNKGGINNVKIF